MQTDNKRDGVSLSNPKKSNRKLHTEDFISAVIKVCFMKSVSRLNYHEHYFEKNPQMLT